MGKLFTLIAFGFWLYTFYHIIKSPKSIDKKIIWFLLVLIIPLIGIVLYYFLGREKHIPAMESSSPKTRILNNSYDENPRTENDFYVSCVNCGTTYTNPTDNLCSNCGKDMNKKYNNIKCSNCGNEYEISLVSCPYCGS